jgi:cell division protein FtsZ
MDDLLPFDLPGSFPSIIKVLGVGGGGSNAVNHMFRQGIKGVDFIVTNTDIQALSKSPVPVKIQLGKTLTEGLGSGNQPDRGREAAIENIEDVKDALGFETKMVFITAGMGGGTGTGGAPVIAKAAKEMGILTVGIVTIPFRYEGRKRIESAIEGISKMEKHVDALLVINNEKIREIYGNLKGSEALGKADEVLTVAARGIAEIITKEGYINVDFADVKTVMQSSGIALLGTGSAEGEGRVEKAIKQALTSPLLDSTDIRGAKNILLNIVSGRDEATMDEISFINEYVQEAAGNGADLIWGSSIDDNLGDSIAVTVIATGFGSRDIPELYASSLVSNGTFEKPERIEIGFDKEPELMVEDDDHFFDNYDYSPKITVKKPETSSNPELDKIIIREKKTEDHVFEINESSKPQKVIEVKQKKPDEKVNIGNYKNRIDELEEVPAYKRKGIKVNAKPSDEKEAYSRYTLSDDNGEIALNKNNSYLHDKAD